MTEKPDNLTLAATSATLTSAVRSTLTVCACVLLALAVIALGYAFDVDTDPITGVSGHASDSARFPSPAERLEWHDVQLPYRLCPAGEAPCFDHYRVTLPTQQGTLGVFVPEFAGSLRIAVNDVELAMLGSFAAPIERILFQPAYVKIPDHLLGQDQNWLQLTIGADRGNFVRLSPFYVDTPQALTTSFRLARLLSTGLLVVSTGIYLVLGFLALLSFLLSDAGSRMPLFVWFAAITACAAARNTFFMWTDPNYDFLRDMIYYQSSLGMLAAIVGFVGSLVGLGSRRLYIGVCVATVPLVLAFGWAILDDYYHGSHFANISVRLLAAVTGAITLVLLARFGSPQFKPVKPWIFGMFAGALVLVLHDIVPALTPGPPRYQLSNIAPLLLVLAFCFILAQQFSNALRRVHQHNIELETALEKREAALREAYEGIRQRDRTHAVHKERTRILQDVHDGVAGRLAGLVLMARRRGESAIAEQVESSLADLRLIMDSLDEELSGNLRAALELYQTRTEPLLRNNDLTSQWQIVCPDQLAVPPGWIVNMLRALQETLHNVLRHADASHVQVQLEVQNQQLRAVVQDDGQGIASDQPEGRGLQNIRNRVDRCGGTVSFDTENPGCRVRMQVPLPTISQEYGGTDDTSAVLALPP